MATIDERVVSMKMNNSDFESKVKQTLGSLANLAKGLKLDGAAKGLQQVNSAARSTNFAPLASSVDGIASKFNAMSVIGVTALATITNKAVSAGLSMAKSLTLSPLQSGFAEYELKMGSIQTILSNTARYGTKLPEVTANLDELNKYADKTIYNFGDMTKNIGLFTNAGIRVGDATSMIKGFSNEAAASGTSAQGAASAAYQLSQALSAGKVTLMDWRSLQNVGMGNKNMQNGILEIAGAMGTLEKKGLTSKQVQKDFNGSLKDGWLSADVMSNYLKIMAGDMTVAQMKTLGLTNMQIKMFQMQQANAEDAATKVRTWTQLIGTIRESIGSRWAETFGILIGDFNQATDLFTGINDSLGGVIGKMSESRNALLKEFASEKLGGRTAMIEGLKNIFVALGIVLKTVGQAFRSVFPAKTAAELAGMAKTFRDFTEKLKMGGETADNLKRTLAGVFAIFKVGYTIISGVVKALFSLFGIAQGGTGGILALTAAVGDFVVGIQEWLVSSGRIKAFFATIDTARAAILVPLVAVISNVAKAFGALLSGDVSGFVDGLKDSFGGLGALVNGVWSSMTSQIRGTLANLRDLTGVAGGFVKSLGIEALKPIQTMLEKISTNFGKLRETIGNFGLDVFNKGTAGAAKGMGTAASVADKARSAMDAVRETFARIGSAMEPAISSISKLIGTITDKITEFIGSLTAQDALAVVNTGFFIMMYKAIKDFVKNLDGMTNTFAGIGQNLKDVMETIKTSVTDTLGMMQKSVKANIILKIAIALGVLAASLWVLSTIDPKALATSMVALSAMLYAMTKAMGSMLGMLDVVEGETPKSMGQILATGGALLLLAGAILLLSVAVKQLAGLDWKELVTGLAGVGALLAALALFTKFAELEDMSMKGAASLILLSGAIYLLSFSVEKLGKMDIGQLKQGAVALAAILAMLAATSAVMSTFGAAGAPGILAMTAALSVMVPVIAALGLLPFDVVRQGLGVLAIGLGLLAGTAVLMSTFGKLGAPGIIAMALSLAILTPVLMTLGLLPYEVLAKGLGTVAIALGVLALAAALMGNPMALSGSIGILAMAGALAILAPVILMLGQADFTTLALGLGAIAIALTLFLAAGLAAMYVGPGLFVLGQSIALLGAAMLLAGVGFLAFATGFAALAAIGTAGFAVLTVGFMGLLQMIPLAAQQIGLGMVAFTVTISKAGPPLIRALTRILIMFLQAIDKAAPQFFETMGRLIMGMVNKITQLIPRIAAAGLNMIVNLLRAVRSRIGEIVSIAADIIVKFINGISAALPRIIDSGVRLIIAFVNGLANAIRSNQAQMNDAGRNLATAIVQGMANGIAGGLSIVTNAARNLARSALSAARGLLGIRSPSREFAKLGAFSAQGFVVGLDGGKAAIIKSVLDLQSLIKASQSNAAADIKALEAKLKKLNGARTKDKKAIREVTAALMQARIELEKSNKAWKVSRSHNDELTALKKLADRQEILNQKIVDAKKALEEAKKAKDDFARDTSKTFEKMPDIGENTKLPDYIKDLEKQIVDTQLFNAQLEELKKLGLNEDTYRDLLAKGTSAMPFVQQILESGQAGVDQLNTLETALDKSAGTLGSTAAEALYQAGIDAAAGLVKGLEQEQKAIEAQMDIIAASMVAAIKKALGIKSPSRKFMQVGKWSAEGLAKGLYGTQAVTDKAAAGVGDSALESLRKSLSGMSETIKSHVDLDPTIRPVLDLSDIHKNVGQIGSLLGGQSIDVTPTVKWSREIAADYSSSEDSKRPSGELVGGDNLTFNQFINSPKAVSAVETYRGTKSLVSTAKGALRK